MTLIFVYNADGGFFNVAADMAHKIFSPATYPCSLCDLTYGIFTIRAEWKEFVEQAPVPLVFLHKKEFHATYPAWRKTELPVVMVEKDKGLDVLITTEELNSLESVAWLKKMILERISRSSIE